MTRTHRVLLVLFLAQLGLLALIWPTRGGNEPSRPDASILLEGHQFDHLPLGPAGGLPLRDPAGGQWTLVLAFSASCQWCDSVAPSWEALTSVPPAGVRMVGVSQDAAEVAHNYALAHRWHFHAVHGALDSAPGSLPAQLTSRTPWFYLFDADGILRRTGHGAAAARSLDELLPVTINGATRP